MSTLEKLPRNSLHRLDSFSIKQQSILRDGQFNRGTAFTPSERESLNLRGLLPQRVEDIETQRARIQLQFKSLDNPLQKYIFLTALKERNETLFYNFLLHNLEETLPIVYTPTVGEACVKFNSIWRLSEGMYFSREDMGCIRHLLDNWPRSEVDIIVVTDGSRILGLGDLGANGMGIPIGKLSLYVAAAGFHPARTLPVLIDAGTNNEKLLADPLYLGQRHKRLDNETYYKLVDEFLVAVKDKWPLALVQFEDFSNDHCFELLDMYRNKQLCFNDDIQGTGAVIASGFVNACKVTGTPMKEHKLVFLGAGSAGVGVADTIVKVMESSAGIDNLTARRRFWLVDSKGLVTTTRGDTLQHYKIPYARDDVPSAGQLSSLLEVVKAVKPTALIGLSGMPNTFTQEIIEEMSKHCSRPIIFALSNPTSKAECSARQAYEWSNGTAVFASGSPFDPVELNGRVYVPGQGNNMYIFPGLGFGSVLSQASKVTDEMIITAATTLADCITPEEIASGKIYPSINKIRDISEKISANVMQVAYQQGVATLSPKPADLLAYVKANTYIPEYLPTEFFSKHSAL